MATAQQESFIVARIGATIRLLELSFVREIVPVMELAKPSGVGGVCRGIATIRGELVPVYDVQEDDLRSEPELEIGQLIVIARSDSGASIGILVDDVLDVVQLETHQVVAHAAGRGRMVRSVNLDGLTVLVLTTREVIDAA